MSILAGLPKMREAVLMIAHDNGCINRYESEEKLLANCDLSLLFGICNRPMLEKVEADLTALSEDDFQTVCIGDEDEAAAIITAHEMADTQTLLEHFYRTITE